MYQKKQSRLKPCNQSRLALPPIKKQTHITKWVGMYCL